MSAIVLRASIGAMLRRSDAFTLLEGPAGSGKSNGYLSLLMLDAIKYPGCRILLTRETRTSMTQSTLTTLEEEVFPAFGMKVPGGAGRENRSEYRLPNGSLFAMIGLEDPERTYSTAWDRIMVEEGHETQKESVLKLNRALRGTKTPNSRLVVVTNPAHPSHYLNLIAEPAGDDLRRVETRADYARLQRFNLADPPAGKWKRIITKHQDNPYYFDLDAWKYTDFGAKYITEKLGAYTGHLRAKLLEGRWVAASGTVYPVFDRDTHVVPAFRPPEDWPIYMGYDPGRDHPTGISWLTVSPDNAIYAMMEIYEGGKSVKEHCERIRHLEDGRMIARRFGDPNEFFSNRAQGDSCAKQARADGLRFSPWPRLQLKAKDAAINAVLELLIEATRPNSDKPRLFIMDNCQSTINEFESWSYRRTRTGEVPDGDDQYEDRDNHIVGDVLPGMMASGQIRYERPKCGVVEWGESEKA